MSSFIFFRCHDVKMASAIVWTLMNEQTLAVKPFNPILLQIEFVCKYSATRIYNLCQGANPNVGGAVKLIRTSSWNACLRQRSSEKKWPYRSSVQAVYVDVPVSRVSYTTYTLWVSSSFLKTLWVVMHVAGRPLATIDGTEVMSFFLWVLAIF